MSSYYTEDFLMHHGILGQQWGVRRYQNLDGTLTSLGKSGTWDQKTESSGSTYDSIKADAVAANGGGIMAWGYSKNRNMNCELCAVDYEMRRRGYDTTASPFDAEGVFNNAKSSGFSSVWAPMREAALHDPGASSSARDDALTAYANQIADSYYEHYVRNVSDVFPGATICSEYGDPSNRSSSVSQDDSNKFMNDLAQQGDGARGMVIVYWAQSTSGHAMAYEVVGDQTYLIDAQTGKVCTTNDEAYQSRLGSASYISAYRLDQLPVNDDELNKKGIITDSDKAQLYWDNQSLAKQMQIDKIEKTAEDARKHGRHEYSLAEQGYAFVSKTLNNVSNTVSDIGSSISNTLNTGANFVTNLFK